MSGGRMEATFAMILIFKGRWRMQHIYALQKAWIASRERFVHTSTGCPRHYLRYCHMRCDPLTNAKKL
jgi:hypothetical protein